MRQTAELYVGSALTAVISQEALPHFLCMIVDMDPEDPTVLLPLLELNQKHAATTRQNYAVLMCILGLGIIVLGFFGVMASVVSIRHVGGYAVLWVVVFLLVVMF